MNVSLLPLVFGAVMLSLGVKYLLTAGDELHIPPTGFLWWPVCRDLLFALLAYLIAGGSFALAFDFKTDPRFVPPWYVLTVLSLCAGIVIVEAAKNGSLYLSGVGICLLLMVGAALAPL